MILILSLTLHFAFALSPDLKTLPIDLTASEQAQLRTIKIDHTRGAKTPEGHVRALGEWEPAQAVMTLWANASLISALTHNGPVILFADSQNDVRWWQNFIAQNKNIISERISYYVIPTDSIWIRDYGPFWILDGNGQVGGVDTIYNRPRPLDDVAPAAISKYSGIEMYQPGLVHTGGNFYADSFKNAFSSTLVFDENQDLTAADVLRRMFDYLGIEKYFTTDLGKRVTIEHIDTFAKLVSPDTWVIAKFQSGGFKKDTEAMIEKLSKELSPYGTPYKIFRMPMISDGASNYRAYINSFISNGALFMPAYGDHYDQEASQIYQAALPGYKIYSVDAKDTMWGDSVHCRTRNLIAKDSLYAFPEIKNDVLKISVFYPARTTIKSVKVYINADAESYVYDARATDRNNYILDLSSVKGARSKDLWIHIEDRSGHLTQIPRGAPEQKIDFL